MARGRGEECVQVQHAWVWREDATWRWRRALRLLLQAEGTTGRSTTEQEEQHEQDGDSSGSLRAGLDRAAGGAADH